jgi:putative CocE/NonD family hydrolase
MITVVTPSDPFVEWPTGVPIPMDIGWFHFTSGHVRQSMIAVDWSDVYWHLPLYTMDERIGRIIPSYREEFDHPQLDEFWEPLRYQNKFDQIDLPVLHISGWYDDEQIGTPLNFIGMTTRAKTAKARRSQKMLMGPWPHKVNSTSKLADVEFGPDAVIDLDGYQRRWFDYWLKGIDNGIMDEPPVRIFVMGTNEWRDENEWPLARVMMTEYYIHSGGRANSLFGDGTLSIDPPEDEPFDSYRYDPADPVPFITDPEFSQIGSADDYRPIERRDDVLVYTTEELTEDTEICGPISVKLYAASSAKDTDFTAKLIDVWPTGYAQRLCDGMVRARFRGGMEKQSLIEPGKVYAYTIDCWNTCQVFKKGHLIRLEISSSAFPKYDRNLNTGETLGKTTTMKVAEQKIYHNTSYPSHITLPVME